MKRTFFSSLAVGVMLAAGCFSGCGSKEGVFVDDPKQDLVFLRIIDKSKQNLLGTNIGLINPCEIKITSLDNFSVRKNCGQSPIDGITPFEMKLVGDGWFFGFDNQGKLMKPILDAHNGRYDFVYYVDLPSGDRDTLIIKRGEFNPDTNETSTTYYNGEKALIFNNVRGSSGFIYLIKNNN